jgi:hypothetical protein
MCAFIVATTATVIALGVSAGRRQVIRAPEWWIPLFLKAGSAAALGTAAGTMATEYASWHIRDTEAEQIVRRSSVRREERQLDRTVYDFNVPASGGWGKLVRYDFRVVWEEIAAMGAVGGVLGALLSLFVARTTIRLRAKPTGFEVTP